MNTTEESTDMDAKRRNSIQKIGTIFGRSILLGYQPFSFGQSQSRSIKLHDEEILAIGKTSLPIWWRLYFEGHHKARPFGVMSYSFHTASQKRLLSSTSKDLY